MKYIDHPFPWTNKLRWAWTDDDVKLLQVINDVNDVTSILDRFVPGARRTCVQAGAACGVWPFRLSLEFNSVVTVEPLADNYECASNNLRERTNIRLLNGCFGSGQEGGMVGMKQHPNERNNAGSQQVELSPGAAAPTYSVFTIDELIGSDDVVDFIALDLEGYELEALRGAHRVLEDQHPVVMVEDKGLSAKFGVPKGAVVDFLKTGYSYRVAETIKRDVILV